MKSYLHGIQRRVAAMAGIMGMLLAVSSGAADDLTVKAKKAGRAVAIEAQATVTAPFDLIWATLTDYDHLSEFIPGMRSSKVIGREGPAAIVEQEGEAGFLFFSYGIDVVVESAEYPPGLIEIHVRSGNLRRLDGAYFLSPADEPGTWILGWSGLIEPSLPVPGFLSVGIMRRNIQAQFSGMVAEIERRQAVAVAAAARPPLLASSVLR